MSALVYELCVRAFQSGAEMNRRCGSRTVLTGSPGTIALTDPSNWVHMRIKTFSLPLWEFFLFPFSALSALPTVNLPPYSFSFLCLFLPLSFSPLLSFCFFSSATLSIAGCSCSVWSLRRCWVSSADQIRVPKHLLVFSVLSPSVIRVSTVALVCPCPVGLNWKLWSACPPFCCF